jgi:hypothetical protein
MGNCCKKISANQEPEPPFDIVTNPATSSPSDARAGETEPTSAEALGAAAAALDAAGVAFAAAMSGRAAAEAALKAMDPVDTKAVTFERVMPVHTESSSSDDEASATSSVVSSSEDEYKANDDPRPTLALPEGIKDSDEEERTVHAGHTPRPPGRAESDESDSDPWDVVH